MSADDDIRNGITIQLDSFLGQLNSYSFAFWVSKGEKSFSPLWYLFKIALLKRYLNGSEIDSIVRVEEDLGAILPAPPGIIDNRKKTSMIDLFKAMDETPSNGDRA
ncbi:MAG: hypothetical protein KDI83_13705 [Gammaproteobacteria bacterium]|nr:hypothetical protein [Gammaproteobacteria bacterium]